MESMTERHIGIVGSGLIGRSWAMLFVAQGYTVHLYDNIPGQIQGAIDEILVQLRHLESQGLLRGHLSVEQQHALVKPSTDITHCVKGAKYIQECIPEQLELKQKLFAEIDLLLDDKTILASSSSSMPVSMIVGDLDLKHKSHFIISHPTNPPFYCPLVEVCPAPYTEAWVTDTTVSIMQDIKQTPVLIKKELYGFVLNRIQYAIVNACIDLTQDDVISVEEVDMAMANSLGLRFAFCGPLELFHIGAEGIRNSLERYGGMFDVISSSAGPVPKITEAVKERLSKEMEKRVPIARLAERRRWRDTRLMALAKLKQDLSQKK